MSGFSFSREKSGESGLKVGFSYADFPTPSTPCPTASGAFREPLPASSATFLILESPAHPPTPKNPQPQHGRPHGGGPPRRFRQGRGSGLGGSCSACGPAWRSCSVFRRHWCRLGARAPTPTSAPPPPPSLWVRLPCRGPSIWCTSPSAASPPRQVLPPAPSGPPAASRIPSPAFSTCSLRSFPFLLCASRSSSSGSSCVAPLGL